MARAPRPGIPPIGNLSREMREALEPITDLVSRVTGSSGIGKLVALNQFTEAYLLGAATLTDVINRVNQLHFEHNAAVAKINEIISRMQED